MTATSPGVSHRRSHAVRELRDLLRTDVLSGRYPAEVLPSEGQLMTRYRASRGVVRDALALLREEGVVDRVQGTGTLVRGRRFERRLVEVHGVIDIEDGPFTSHVLESRVLPMPGVVAHHLGEERGAPCLLVEYIGIAHGAVVGLYTNYVRMPEGERLATVPLRGHWYSYLASVGLAVGQSDLVIESVTADDALADRLGVETGAPVLAIEQVLRDRAGRAFDFAVLRHRGDRLALRSEARFEAADPGMTGASR